MASAHRAEARPSRRPCRSRTTSRRRGDDRPWAELLARTFALDVLACPECGDRMKLVAMVADSQSVWRLLAKLGEPTDPPARSPNRGPPY